MNLLSDLRNELILAILIEKTHSEKFNSKEVSNLVGKVQKMLQPLPKEKMPDKSLRSDSKMVKI